MGSMDPKLIEMRIRSANNNMFCYSYYWHSWSRILFHRSRATEDLAKKLGIPDYVTTVELDLTAINPDSPLHWESTVRHVNIRAHCTLISSQDVLVGSLRPAVVDTMRKMLNDDRLIDYLLHTDLLPLIDWKRYEENGTKGGGVPFTECCKLHLLNKNS